MTTRRARTVPRSPLTPIRLIGTSLALPALSFSLLLGGALAAMAQEEAPEPMLPGEMMSGEVQEEPSPNDVVVPPHWSRYQAPTRYPEGTELHIIVRGDTLWDLSNQYLQNPFLWPQLWDANRYIENPHLIYPGDPVRIPELDVVRPEGEEPGGPGSGPGGTGGPGGEMGPEGGPGGIGGPEGRRRGPMFIPAYEEISIQCTGYYREDESRDFRIFGTEEGDLKIGYATNDIVYLNRGSRDGVSPGDQFYTQRRVDFSSGISGHYIRRTGWVTVLAVQEETATAEITQACFDVHVGDYLKPFEPIPVPLLPNQAPATRLTPETGRMRGRIVASLDDLVSLGQGYLVSIDLGDEDGVVPGNIFTVFRYVYPNAPRKMLGELAILTVQNSHATAKITQSYDYIDVGDMVELK